MHIAMRLVRSLTTTEGRKMSLADTEAGQIGMLPVFETAAAARAVYGDKCETVEVFPEAGK